MASSTSLARKRRPWLLRMVSRRIKARKKQKSRKGMKYKPRTYYDYNTSAWALFMKREGVSDPTHKNGKLFRRRFRLPYPVYQEILARLSEHPNFRDSQDATGRASAPLYLKLLSAMRVMGRGECFDTCYELTNINPETLRTFFHKFVEYVAALYPEYVKAPETDTEIRWVMEQYKRLGFPGCLGSIDCVHIHWERCPAMDANTHCGKEGYPTRAFEVTHTH